MARGLPKPGDVADLVRLPSVLTAPGDALLGDALSGGREPGRVAGLAGASSCLYLAGMALNDYADREVDAEERPHRPIPSGRVSPGFALGLASALTAAGLGLAYRAGGPRTMRVAVPLVGAIWGYDLLLKGTPAGPFVMAAARSLDVLLGAEDVRRALPAAAVVGGHTVVITTVSRREAEGGSEALALGAIAGTAAVAAAARLALGNAPGGRWGRRAVAGRAGRYAAAALIGLYAGTLGGAGAAALRRPDAKALQRFVGTGVLGLMPLEAALMAARGRGGRAAAVAAAWLLARALARRRSVT